jgi:hypothetical protein
VYLSPGQTDSIGVFYLFVSTTATTIVCADLTGICGPFALVAIPVTNRRQDKGWYIIPRLVSIVLVVVVGGELLPHALDVLDEIGLIKCGVGTTQRVTVTLPKEKTGYGKALILITGDVMTNIL